MRMEYVNVNEDIQAREADAPAEEKIECLIQETEEALRNTNSFLDRLRSSEDGARKLVDSMKQRFEKELETLQRRGETEAGW
jgi:hypothetical protein